MSFAKLLGNATAACSGLFSRTRIADDMRVSPQEALLNILVKMKGEGFQIGLPTGKRDAIVTQMLNNPWMDIGSDGIALPADVRTSFGNPHPRSFGSH